MRKVFLQIFVFIVISFHSAAQNFAWVDRVIAGANLSTAVDDSGNTYSTGSFKGVVDFDPGAGVYNLGAAGVSNAYVWKLDAGGNLVWARSLAGASAAISESEGWGICLDKLGNVIVGGYFLGTNDFDPGAATFNMTAASAYDAFILKLDAAGNFVWAKQLAGTWNEGVYAVTTDGSNNIVATGKFSAMTDFDPGSAVDYDTSAGGYDMFVLKLDPSGNRIFSRRIGRLGDDGGVGICTDRSGNIYTTGQFSDSVDFDPGAGVYWLTATPGLREIFVSKLDSSGNFVWAGQMGCPTEDDGAAGIAVDASRNVYVIGSFKGTADFDPGPGTYLLTCASIYTNTFVAKLNSSGNLLWARQFASIVTVDPFSIAIDTFSNVYTCGYFMDTTDFDPGSGTFLITSFGSLGQDAYISKLDSAGNFISASSVTGAAIPHSLVLGKSGDMYIGGNFQGTIDFDPGAGSYSLSSTGLTDIFVLKLTQCLPFVPSIVISAHPGTTVGAGQADSFSAVITGGGASPHYQWYINGVPVAGAVSSIYISDSLADNDSVTCVLTSSDTCATSLVAHSNKLVIHVVSAVSVLDIPQRFTVCPNPNTGTFTISCTGLKDGADIGVLARDMLGKTIFEGKMYARNGRLNDIVQLTNGLANGVYTLQLTTKKESTVVRFCVER